MALSDASPFGVGVTSDGSEGGTDAGGLSEGGSAATDAGATSTPGAPAGDQVGPPTGAEGDDAGWQFQWGDKKFGTQDEATRYFSTWNGRISKADRERNEALTAVNAWDTWYKQNKDALDGALAGGVKAQPKDAPKGAADGLLSQEIWDYFNQLRKDGREAEAQAFLAFKTDEFVRSSVKSVRDDFRQELESAVGPAREQAAVKEMAGAIAQAATEAIDPDTGDARFPELSSTGYNAGFANHFRDVWFGMPLQIALAQDLSGIELAYWRTKATFRPTAASNGETVEGAVDGATEEARADMARRAGAIGGSPAPHKIAPPGKGKGKTGVEALMDGLHGKRDPVFGTLVRD